MAFLQNYTVHDVAGYSLALLVFPLVFFIPGYLLGWLLNVLEFRLQPWLQRMTISVTLSVATGGVVTTLIGRWFSLTTALRLFELCGLAFVVLLLWEIRKRGLQIPHFGADSALGTLILLAWTLLTITILVDLEIGHRLYPNVISYDHCIRASFSRSAIRTGIPPANPFFYPGTLVPLRYYYFWNVLCALPTLLAGIDPRLTLYASCAWSGFALMATIVLYLKHCVLDGARLGRKALLGVALLTVTGLDIIPTIFMAVAAPHVVYAEMEWWDHDLIASWANSLLWTPHHVAALVACLFGFLLLWKLSDGSSANARSRSERAKAIVLAAMAFASAAGYSVYITFTFVLFMGLWTAMVWWQRRLDELWALFLTGLTALLLSLPYLRELLGPGQGYGFATFAIRRFPQTQMLLSALGVHSHWARSVADLLLMPGGLFLELGFFFAIAVLQWRLDQPLAWKNLSRHQQALWAMLAASLFVSCFLRSQTIANNDLGWRGALLMQFVLLLWAVPFLDSGWRVVPWQGFLQLLLVLGVVGSTYQLLMLRSYPMLADSENFVERLFWLPKVGKVGKTSYQLRQDFENLNRVLPSNLIIQANPLEWNYVPRLLYDQHQEVAAVTHCGAEFGGDFNQCAPIQFRLVKLFYDPNSAESAAVDRLCDELYVDFLIAGPEDPVWKAHSSWVWTRPTLYTSNVLRALPCGTRSRISAR